MRKLRYHLVDVFTDRAFGGNPLAVPRICAMHAIHTRPLFSCAHVQGFSPLFAWSIKQRTRLRPNQKIGSRALRTVRCPCAPV